MENYKLLTEVAIKFNEKDFNQALEIANKIIKNDSELYEGYYWKGKCYKELFYQSYNNYQEKERKKSENSLIRKYEIFRYPKDKAKLYIDEVVKNFTQAIELHPDDKDTFFELLDFFEHSDVSYSYGKMEIFSLLKDICEKYYLSSLYLWNEVIQLATIPEVYAVDKPEVQDILLEFANELIEVIKLSNEKNIFEFERYVVEGPIKMLNNEYDYLIDALFLARDILEEKKDFKKLEKILWEIMIISYYNDKQFVDIVSWMGVIDGYCEIKEYLAEFIRISKLENVDEVKKEISELYDEIEKSKTRTKSSRKDIKSEWKLHNRVAEFKHILKGFIVETLKDGYGDKWWEDGIPGGVISDAVKRTHGPINQDFNKIYVGAYKIIISCEKNWYLFQEVFPSKEWVKKKFSVLVDARVDEAHQEERIYSDAELKELDDIVKKINYYLREKKGENDFKKFD